MSGQHAANDDAHTGGTSRGLLVGLGALIVVLAGAVVWALTTQHGQKAAALPDTSPTPTASAGTTPQQLMAAVAAATRQQSSVHVEATLRTPLGPGRITNDAGRTVGVQHIALSGGVAEVRFVAGTAYLQGNARALELVMQASPAVAARAAGRWLSVRPTDKAYADVSDTLTMPSVVTDITLTGDLTTTGVIVRNGRRVIGITGDEHGGGTGTLYVSAVGAPLPVELTGTDQGVTETVVFGGWGEPVGVSAPVGATPASAAGIG